MNYNNFFVLNNRHMKYYMKLQKIFSLYFIHYYLYKNILFISLKSVIFKINFIYQFYMIIKEILLLLIIIIAFK